MDFDKLLDDAAFDKFEVLAEQRYANTKLCTAVNPATGTFCERKAVDEHMLCEECANEIAAIIIKLKQYTELKE